MTVQATHIRRRADANVYKYTEVHPVAHIYTHLNVLGHHSRISAPSNASEHAGGHSDALFVHSTRSEIVR